MRYFVVAQDRVGRKKDWRNYTAYENALQAALKLADHSNAVIVITVQLDRQDPYRALIAYVYEGPTISMNPDGLVDHQKCTNCNHTWHAHIPGTGRCLFSASTHFDQLDPRDFVL